jgi:bifunctional DNA-binding transcriptional regulator/antitoxin component of YhaV-PrlF toxin-antitoxin module
METVMGRKKNMPEPRQADRPGFGEAPQAAFIASEDCKLGFGVVNRMRLTLGPGGRVVIPAALREAMEVDEGDSILAWVEEGELHLLSPRVGARQAQAMLKGLIPKAVSLAQELLADRRREAEAERNG